MAGNKEEKDTEIRFVSIWAICPGLQTPGGQGGICSHLLLLVQP